MVNYLEKGIFKQIMRKLMILCKSVAFLSHTIKSSLICSNKLLLGLINYEKASIFIHDTLSTKFLWDL